jgi:hypothetical protein
MIVWKLDLQLLMQPVPITTNVVNSNAAHGEAYSTQHYVSFPVSSTNKTDRYDITEILLNEALNTTILTQICPYVQCTLI